MLTDYDLTVKIRVKKDWSIGENNWSDGVVECWVKRVKVLQ
jgi:hypothetical protein